MIVSPETTSSGIENAQFRAVNNVSVNRLEQQKPSSEVLYFPTSLDNPEARKRILDNGADPLDVAKVFDDEGRWVLRGQVGDYPTIWQSDPALAVQAVLIELRPAYDLADYNLLGQKWPHGFNKHNIEDHVVDVLQWSDFLLNNAGYSRELQIKRITGVAAAGHDAANAIDRFKHADLSATALATVMPDLAVSNGEWKMVSDAIEHHDEKRMYELFAESNTHTPEDQVRVVQAKGPVIAALVMADKGGSIGRHRTNPWARTKESVNGDTHMWVNYLANGRGFEYSRDRRTLSNIIEYNPEISQSEYNEFVELAKETDNYDNYRAYVPEVVRRVYRKDNIPHFFSWSSNMMGTYLERFKLEAVCAKALNPGLDKFVIDLRDRVNGRRRIVEEIQFDGTLSQQFHELDLAYRPKEQRRPEDYKQAELVFEGPLGY